MNRVLKVVSECQNKNILYLGQANNNEKRGKKLIINIYLHKAQLIAESIETGNSLEETTQTVNDYWEQLDDPTVDAVTESAVRSCIQ